MKKLQLEICCGTTCYMLGANRLLNIENEMPSELRGKCEVKALPCMGLCNDKELAGAPYVKLNGIVIENATAEKIYDKIRELLEA
ncbi:MAG: NAD(P)H-dependent oxidoreductase subunit E [Lentisphaeria bacterium]|nr:NAD(P)H-dependent oxidoreductase subunit E [Lentisphaeria bacterium]MBQ7397168.1 NAD(P)H-dependent oxidoreductase subunit E [Lentisphaeria bacterium]MBR7119250.1 NAD(P)H-dependent oxidoreductase subunit E [Lentisphaeria bacterium]